MKVAEHPKVSSDAKPSDKVDDGLSHSPNLVRWKWKNAIKKSFDCLSNPKSVVGYLPTIRPRLEGRVVDVSKK